jgi:hypothetical protein
MSNVAREIINTHNQLLAAHEANLPDVAIYPRHWSCGRNTYRDGWKVGRPGKNLGTETNPYDWDYGCKVFNEREFNGETWRDRRQQAFVAAVMWASGRYKVARFVRNRMGDYVDERVNKMFPLRKK